MNLFFATVIANKDRQEALKLLNSFPQLLLDEDEVKAKDKIIDFNLKYGSMPSIQYLIENGFESFSFYNPSPDPIGAVFESVLKQKRETIIRSLTGQINDAVVNGKNYDKLIDQLSIVRNVTEQNAISIKEFKFEFNPTRLGIKTGVSVIDNDISFLSKGETMFFVARPNTGKTNLLVHTMLNIVEQGKRILFMNGEMTNDSIIAKLIAMKFNFSPGLMRSQIITDEDKEKIEKGLEYYQNKEQDIFFSKGVASVAQMRDLIVRHQPDVVLGDAIYRWSGVEYKNDIYQNAAGIARSFVETAKLFNIPLIGTTQVNRAGSDNPTGANIAYTDAYDTDPDCVFALQNDGGLKYQLIMSTIKNRLGNNDLKARFKVSPISLRFQEI